MLANVARRFSCFKLSYFFLQALYKSDNLNIEPADAVGTMLCPERTALAVALSCAASERFYDLLVSHCRSTPLISYRYILQRPL